MSNTPTRNVKEGRMDSVARSWIPKPILNPEIMDDLPTIDAYVGILKEKKKISMAIQTISAILPGFEHLKRCSANKILLAPVLGSSNFIGKVNDKQNDEITSEDRLKILLKEKGFDLTLLEDDLRVIKVPGTAAKTKAQAARASKIWPVKFHPDPFLEAIIDGSIFTEDHLRKIENYMNIAILAAKLEAVGDRRCNGSAVVVDPEDGRVLAIAASKIDRHPMWHASMLAIDLIAKLHGGGAWNLDDEIHQGSSFLRNDAGESQGFDAGNFEKRMKIIKRKYEDEAPLCYPKTLKKIPIPAGESLRFEWRLKGRRNNGQKKDVNLESLETDVTDVAVGSNEKCGPYLCTNYSVFLLEEPCPMCAMALLHSRVARIFYGVANEITGVLGSNGVLHAVPGLNHRYRVWSDVMKDTCCRVSREIQERNVDNEVDRSN